MDALPSSTRSLHPVDYAAVARQVYDFAASQAPLAPRVQEALGVIEEAMDCFGCVLSRCD